MYKFAICTSFNYLFFQEKKQEIKNFLIQYRTANNRVGG